MIEAYTKSYVKQKKRGSGFLGWGGQVEGEVGKKCMANMNCPVMHIKVFRMITCIQSSSLLIQRHLYKWKFSLCM